MYLYRHISPKNTNDKFGRLFLYWPRFFPHLLADFLHICRVCYREEWFAGLPGFRQFPTNFSDIKKMEGTIWTSPYSCYEKKIRFSEIIAKRDVLKMINRIVNDQAITGDFQHVLVTGLVRNFLINNPVIFHCKQVSIEDCLIHIFVLFYFFFFFYIAGFALQLRSEVQRSGFIFRAN